MYFAQKYSNKYKNKNKHPTIQLIIEKALKQEQQQN